MVNTFLPFPDVRKSLSCLDRRRLFKQSVEAMQILRVNLGLQGGVGFTNHPAVRMWKGYETLLGSVETPTPPSYSV